MAPLAAGEVPMKRLRGICGRCSHRATYHPKGQPRICVLAGCHCPGALGSSEYPDLLTPTRDALVDIGIPWVIENVPTAPLEGFVLCGSTFGLPVVRHRLFESSVPMLAPSLCPQRSWQRGTAHPGAYPYAHGSWRPAWREFVLPVVWPWMTLEESADAIPPAYTEWIGTQLLKALARAA